MRQGARRPDPRGHHLSFDLFIHRTSEVLTCDGPWSADAEATLAALPRGAVGIIGSRVAWLGTQPPRGSLGPATRILDARGGFVGPGFVECHTHLVFAGDRSEEFEQRCRGLGYLEIAARGGGIRRTVEQTNAATDDTLFELGRVRLARFAQQGVTSIEVKSGYGLEVEAELRLLRVARRLGESQPLRVVPTVLPLHAMPTELALERAEWLRRCVEELLPRVRAEGLAGCCDAFVEEGAFTREEARVVLARARELGFTLRLHVDQLTAGQGAELAAELGAMSADHLEHVSRSGIEALRAAGTVAVLAPISTLCLRAPRWAPGRALRDAGVPVAVTTNCNPGSSMSENVFLALGLACLHNGLTPAEAYLGFTRVAGLALGQPALGRLTVGGPADLVVYAAESYRQLPYHLGMCDVSQVVIAGQPVPMAARPDPVPKPPPVG